jgi:hypothetical protein
MATSKANYRLFVFQGKVYLGYEYGQENSFQEVLILIRNEVHLNFSPLQKGEVLRINAESLNSNMTALSYYLAVFESQDDNHARKLVVIIDFFLQERGMKGYCGAK